MPAAAVTADRPRDARWKPPSTLPPLYARWIDDLLGEPLPSETEATCERCAMLPPAGAPPLPTQYFAVETKCCTYVPTLPNFLVGRVLDDDDVTLATGRAALDARIEARIGVSPLGVQPGPVHTLLYRTGAAAGFGRSRALRCPYFVVESGGACGIWRHRNSVCSTWFCKYARGAAGQHFWQALEQLLATVERELARWCLLRLDVDTTALACLLPRGTDRVRDGEALDAAALDGGVDADLYRRQWGAWYGRERELYRAAGRLVGDLGWQDVLHVGGASVETYARIAADARGALHSAVIPERLVAGPLQTLTTGRHHVRVTTYSPYDPLALPRALVDVLGYFDGRPTAEALRRIREERGLNLQPELIRRLVDFGVLVAAGGETLGGPATGARPAGT